MQRVVNGAAVKLATYLVGPRGPEYRRDDTTGAIRWYLYDGLGSVVGEVDPSGNVTVSRKYDVYGLVRGGDAGTSTHKFVGALGHPSEAESGLVYMQARYMDPAIGRFVSEDPGLHGDNWFAYASDNATCRIDRNGKEDNWIEIIDGMFEEFGIPEPPILKRVIHLQLQMLRNGGALFAGLKIGLTAGAALDAALAADSMLACICPLAGVLLGVALMVMAIYWTIKDVAEFQGPNGPLSGAFPGAGPKPD